MLNRLFLYLYFAVILKMPVDANHAENIKSSRGNAIAVTSDGARWWKYIKWKVCFIYWGSGNQIRVQWRTLALCNPMMVFLVLLHWNVYIQRSHDVVRDHITVHRQKGRSAVTWLPLSQWMSSASLEAPITHFNISGLIRLTSDATRVLPLKGRPQHWG